MSQATDDRRAAASARLECWGQYVGGLTQVPDLLRSLGVDPAPVLLAAGLEPAALAHAEHRIEYEAFGRLMRSGAEATGLPHFGLLVGRQYRLAEIGLLGDIVRNCATLGDALERLTVHQQLNSPGGLSFVLVRAGVVDLGHAVFYPGMTGVDQVLDGCLAAGFNYVRELIGTSWHPTEVFLPHQRPASSLPYRQFFGVEPRFNADFCAMRFPAYWLSQPIPAASAERLRLAESRAAALSPNVVMLAYRGLRVLLMHGQCSGDDLARVLAMHRRTLNRRLNDAGTTFQAILDDVRFEVARQLLGYTDRCLDDIAASLGYSAVGPFMRRFHDWTGETPRRWRQHFENGTLRSDGSEPRLALRLHGNVWPHLAARRPRTAAGIAAKG